MTWGGTSIISYIIISLSWCLTALMEKMSIMLQLKAK